MNSKKFINKIILFSILFFMFYISNTKAVFANSNFSGTVLEDNLNSAPISGVKIQLTNTKTGKTYSTLSDSNGKYKLENLPDGDYTAEYRYGDTAVLNEFKNSDLTEQNILKYNGHDFIVSEIDASLQQNNSSKDATTTDTEIMIVIDCSGSMRSFKQNGEIVYSLNPDTDPTRFNLVKPAAINLAKSILNYDSNIKVGIAPFGYSLIQPVLKPTNNFNTIKQKISSLEIDWHPNNNDSLALKETKNYFSNSDSTQKIIIFIADGNPSSYTAMKNEIQKAQKENYKVCSLIIHEFDDDRAAEEITKAYGTADVFTMKPTGQELVNYIQNDIPNWIKKTTKEIKTQTPKQEGINQKATSTEAGLEDKSRRNTVNKYFSNTFYSNASKSYDNMSGKSYLFESLKNINNFSSEEISNLSKNTYMTYTYKNLKLNSNTKSSYFNIKLKRRDNFSMQLYTNPTSLRIKDKNGKTLYENSNITTSTIVIPETLQDPDYKVEIEYEVSILNASKSISCNYIELVSYLPEGFSIKNETQLISNPSLSNKTNGWKASTIKDMQNAGYITHSNTELLDKNIAFFSTKNMNFNLQSNYMAKTSFVVTADMKTINTSDYSSKEYVEIVGYNNSNNKRMTNNDLIGIYPGNGNFNEPDSAISPNLDFAFLDVPEIPEQPEDPDEPKTPEPTEPDVPETKENTIIIKGNVSENLEAENLENAPVAGVRVELTNSATGEKYSALSDSTGNYEIKDIPNGKYNIEYRYGDISVLNEFKDSDLTIQDILKYNGHDYIISSNGIIENTPEPEPVPEPEPEIVNEKSEIYLIIDTSMSMTTSIYGKADYGSDPNSKMNIAKSACKSLVEQIIESDSNNSVGLINFDYKTKILSSPTRDVNTLKSLIDNVKSADEAGTYTSYALSTASNELLKTDSDTKKYIILLTDGLPEYQNEYSFQDVINSKAYSDTRNTINEIKNQNISLLTYIIPDAQIFAYLQAYNLSQVDITKYSESDYTSRIDNFNKNFMNGGYFENWSMNDYKNWTLYLYYSIFNNANSTYFITSKTQLITAFTNIVKYIIPNNPQPQTSPSASSTPISGMEDEERRKFVDDKFTSIFKSKNKENPDNLSENSYLFEMIEKINKFSSEEIENLSKNTYMTLTYKNIEISENTKPEYLNIELKRRDLFSLNVSIKPVASRIVLEDGTPYYTGYASEENGLFPDNLYFEMVENGVIDIEFEVDVQNVSNNIDATYLELASYFPKGFELYENTGLILESGTNKSSGWKNKEISTLVDDGKITHDNQTLLNKNIGYFSTTTNLKPNETYQTKFVVTCKIDDVDNIDYLFQSIVEIIGYKNNQNRRMEKLNSVKSQYVSILGNPMEKNYYTGVFPGNGKSAEPDYDETKVFELYFLKKYAVPISGYVTENLTPDNLPSNASFDDKMKYDAPIAGVRVTLTNTFTNKQYTTLSDSKGYYEFKDVSMGDYTIEYTYGDLQVLKDFKDTGLSEQDILKYNGHDYIVSDEMENTTTQTRTLDKNSIQVFLVIDTSGSMQIVDEESDFDNLELKYEKANPNNRMNIIKTASKDLAEKLINADPNIYVGIISFAKESKLRTNCTRNLEELNKQIDDLNSTGQTYTKEALELAEQTIINNNTDQNNVIILLSDGIPENNDAQSSQENAEKYFKEVQSVVDRIGENEKIQLFSLLIGQFINKYNLSDKDLSKLTEEEYLSYIPNYEKFLNFPEGKEFSTDFYASNPLPMYQIFKNSEKLFIKTSAEELSNCMNNEIVGWINEKITQEYKIHLNNYDNPEIGLENEDRRNKVDSYFDSIFHNKASSSLENLAENSYLFNVLNNINSISEDEAKKLSKNTYMTVTYDNIEITRNTVEKRFTTRLKRRSEFSLEVSTKAVGLKVVLSNGYVLSEQLNTDDNIHIFNEFLDSELEHGALVEIEYQVKIKNNSPNIACNYLELASYLPYGLSISDTETLISNPEVSNSSTGWKIGEIKKLKDSGYIVHNDKDLNERKLATFYSNVYIEPGESYTTNFVASKIINDVDDINYNCKQIVEIMGYSNSKNRRMEKVKPYEEQYTTIRGETAYRKAYNGIFPGNGNTKIETINTGSGTKDLYEPDYAENIDLAIVYPPTGKKFNNYIIILPFTIIGLCAFIIIITKKKK